MSYKSLYKLNIINDNKTFNEIYSNRFNSEASIKLNIKMNNREAFIFFHNEINELLFKIRDYDYKIENLLNDFPYIAQNQYIKKSLIDEIKLSNEIEGVISSRKDIFTIMEDINVSIKDKSRLESIVNKYKMLINNKDIRLNSPNDIRNLYDEFIYNEIKIDDTLNLPDGKIFRKEKVYVYNKYGSKIVHEGVYPEEKIIEMMSKSLNILHEENIDPYIRISLFHYLFGYIHPFYDGNGRLNRFISSYLLSKYSVSILKFRLSMSIKENINEYLEAFNECNDSRNMNDLGTFVYHFLNIIYKSYEKTELYLMAKKKDLDYYKEKIENNNYNNKIKIVLNSLLESNLFSEFGLSLNNMIEELKISKSSLNNIISELKNKELITINRIGRICYYSININKL